MAQAIRTGRPHTTQPIVVERPDGRRFGVLEHAYPLLDPSGRPAGAINILVEIGSRWTTDEAAARLAAIVEASDDAIVGMTPEGIVTSWNRGAERIFGYTAAEIFGLPVAKLIPHDRGEEGRGILERLKAGERLSQFETRRVTKEHRIIDVSLTVSPIRDREGSVIAVSLIARDITQRKTGEEELRAIRETLELRVAERTALAEYRARQLSVMAADLIEAEHRERKRIAQVLHDELAQNLALAKMRLSLADPASQGAGETLRQTTEIIGGLIEKARDLMRDLAPTVLDDVGLTAAVESLADRWKEEYGIAVRIEAIGGEPRLPERLRTFAFRAVREALYNVAKHAGTDRARVTLDNRNSEHLVIEISDDGAGFDLSRLHREDMDSHFGLFSLQERAALLSGSVEVESAPGTGTRVRLHLPTRWLALADRDPGRPDRRRTKSAAVPAPQATIQAGRTVRVLLADDHALMREGLANLLTSQPGFEVVGQAGHGQEAVELARTLRPDVILMDVSMPRMSGLEATRVIHREFPDIRIVGLSMHEDGSVVESMRAAGASAYVTKGEDPKTLLAAITGGAAK